MECGKTRTRWIHLALVLLVAGCLALPAGAQDRSQGLGLGPAQGGYDYPVRPGTEAWKALATHDEMVQATQVGDSVLAALADRALLRTVLDYPLLADLMFYDSPQEGFDAVRAQFRGLDTLFERPGMPELLLRRYQRTDAADVPAVLSLVEQGRRAGRLAFIELLLAQPEVLAGMSDALREELLLETLLKREQKLERFDVYGLPGLERTAFTAARALGPAEEAGVVLREGVGAFLETGTAPTVEVLDAVFARTEEAVLGVSSPSLSERGALAAKDYTSTVYTPRGSAVSVIVRTWELSSGEIASCNSYLDQTYPSATRLTNCSRKYNCHSYAWYSQSTSNNKWMNTPGDDKYWQDGSYVSAVLTPNCKASYASDDHSANIITSSQFQSKWGSTAVMRHAPTYTPYDSSDLDYYCRTSTVVVSGPSSRDPNQSGTWYCGVTGVGLQPYSYSWFKSWAGGGYADLGTGTSKTTSHSTSFNIVCDVVDASGRFLGTDFQFVDVDGDPGGPIFE